MKKFITALFCSLIGGTAVAQWTPTTFKKSSKFEPSLVRSYYKLDLSQIREKLKNAQETGKDAKAIEISLPTLSGKVERFAVYSFPVVVKELADQYQLGSYVGVGIDDPNKLLRFSVSPTDFQSMITNNNNGESEFIEPQNADKTVYGVHPKTIRTGAKSFLCSTSEGSAAKQQIDEMLKGGSSFSNQPTDFSKMSDKKYRTMRLAMSVTGEYTTFHGGTVALALSAINATLTRVNGVFEKDFALHLNLQNYPTVIYTNAATDPYSAGTAGAGGAWTLELQQTLTANVGNANYDIGHLFGASGGGGNAGCIGCVCVNPTTAVPAGKGSGYTSPANAVPQGDAFDIDYVAHEIGHQLGANHTFSHSLEGALVNMEPGSGSTIMGYAGITGATTDVQLNSDAYFHKASISQVQANLNIKACDVETTVNNNPPVIAALPTYNIPKGTAFVLTASATDAENDPMTYTWEQVDNASTTINNTNLGSTTTGASFRSLTPTTSPTRYFPKLASVLSGVLDNSNNGWESVSKVARTTKFAVTVRDNNQVATQQQTQFSEQTIVVGNDGPFKINTQFVSSNGATAVTWDVANTTAAPYNVANVKIDYTIDNGVNWVVLSNSTANDGNESFTFSPVTNGQIVKIRISSIGNVFYAIKSATVSTFAACTGSAPTPVTTSNITTSSVDVNWAPITGATYVIRYKKVTDATWQQTTSTAPNITLTGLSDGTAYEVQVATVCSGTTGTYSPSSNFTTTGLTYCSVGSGDATDDHIAGVAVANMSNTSGPSAYTDYSSNSALQVNLVAGSPYTLSVTKGWAGTAYAEMITAWIDFNRNGTFEDSERIMQSSNAAASTTVNPITATFTVPSAAVTGLGLKMRVGLLYYASPGYVHNTSCGTVNSYGEYEDYNVVVTSALSTSETVNPKDGIQIYPNPVTDILNVTKVSDKATYKIYSAAGQLASSGNINGGKINVTSLVKGAYVISIEDKGKESFNSKFIKK
ncbi:MAG: T9SS type A sorting domain-containing protein [Flavobacteriales bacterium]|nr:MAG: T9SS type A sorting domain-containing protein [Flavobacteriales bacterium]